MKKISYAVLSFVAVGILLIGFCLYWYGAFGTKFIEPDESLTKNGTAPAGEPKKNDEAADLLHVTAPTDTSHITSPVTVRGEARGGWYFEASFPIKVLDANRREISSGTARAQKDWMTEDFVPFTASIAFSKPETPGGYLILSKDNPSGLPENDRHIEIPIRFSL